MLRWVLNFEQQCLARMLKFRVSVECARNFSVTKMEEEI